MPSRCWWNATSTGFPACPSLPALQRGSRGHGPGHVLKAFSKLDTFQSNSSFFTWVYRIAKNTILDNLKRKGRSPVRAMEDPEDSLGRVAEGRSGRVPMPDARIGRRADHAGHPIGPRNPARHLP
ncbi:MAG: sigma factor [Planctomycetota bacterium]